MKEGGGKAAVVRDLAPEGDILSIAAAVGALSRNYRQKQIMTHVSERVHGRLDDDLIILGSVAANRYSADFIDRFDLAEHLNLKIDVSQCEIYIDQPKVGEFVINDFDIARGRDNLPRRDLIYIAAGVNPYNPHRRALVCAGFTTYGTGAAGEILFSQILIGHEALHRQLRRLQSMRSTLIIGQCGLKLGKLVHWSVFDTASFD